MTIHPTAVIEAGAVLGPDVTVGPFTYIAGDTDIGAGCRLGPHVTVLPHTTLGPGCQVHAGAVLGDLPQDVSFNGAISYVRIGQQCVLREGVTIHRGTQPDSVTVVGDGCLLMANSHVGHNARLGERVIMANGALVGGYAEVGDRAFISGNCLIHQFTRVGRLVMMSGGSAAQKDVPPFCMTRSSTTNIIMGLNVVGLRRASISGQERQTLQRALRVLYRSGLNMQTAVAKLEQDFDSPLIDEICQFIRGSKRGICKFVKPAERERTEDGGRKAEEGG